MKTFLIKNPEFASLRDDFLFLLTLAWLLNLRKVSDIFQIVSDIFEILGKYKHFHISKIKKKKDEKECKSLVLAL